MKQYTNQNFKSSIVKFDDIWSMKVFKKWPIDRWIKHFKHSWTACNFFYLTYRDRSTTTTEVVTKLYNSASTDTQNCVIDLPPALKSDFYDPFTDVSDFWLQGVIFSYQ